MRPPRKPAVLTERLEWLRECDLSGTRSLDLERRRIRCGRTPCRCAAGHPHGPYYYFRFSDGPDGRRRRLYVPRHYVGHVRRWMRDFRYSRASMRLALRLVYRLYGR